MSAAVDFGAGPSRGFWCQRSARGKFAYLTLDEAWDSAWRLFCYDGRIVTPYRCTTIRVYSVVVAEIACQREPVALVTGDVQAPFDAADLSARWPP